MTDEREILTTALAGRYSVGELLGEGGMGRVFRGTDLRHRRPVAIKVVRPELAGETGRARFEREIGTVASLRHPHIVPLIDSGEVGGVRYLVTPFIDGETLRQRLDREGRLPLDAVVPIARDVAEGLASAHRLGHIHRDIKPSNILLSEGHAIITDFGLAKAVADEDVGLSRTGMMVGSPLYVSPEQAGGESDVDGRTDIYALACVVYEMLAGEPPFTSGRVSGLLAKHMLEAPPDLRVVRPGIPEHVARAVRKAMSKASADRQADALEFARDLAGEGTSTRPAARRASDSRRGAPRRPWTSAVVWAAAGMGLVASALLLRSVGGGGGGPELDGRARGDLMVEAYERPGATDDERTALRRSEVELTRLLTGWDGVGVVPGSSKAALRAELGIAGGAAVSTTDALAMARRAEAGTLVSLEQTITGDSTFLQAQLYDVGSGGRNGAPIPSGALSTDVVGLVAPVASRVLGFERPGRDLVALKRSSTNLDAIRLLYEGRDDLEKWRLERAEGHFRDALTRDSTFGYAHYLLAATLYWRGSTNPGQFTALGGDIRRHASAARRLNTGPYTRSVEAFFAFQNGEYQRARELYESLLASDSSDVYAWLFLGTVEYRDPWTTWGPDGSLIPRGSFNRALDAFLRTVRLDPDFHLGYGHLFDVHQRIAGAARQSACYSYGPPGEEATVLIWETHSTPESVSFCPVVRDTIEFVDRAVFRTLDREELFAGAERLQDRAIVQLLRWADYAPGSPWPQKALADWALARAEIRDAAGSPVPWPELLADAVTYAERALELDPDTLPEDLIRVGNLRLAVGDLEGAVAAVDRAVELAGEGLPSPLRAEAANPYLATGRVGRALAIATVPNPGRRMTIPDGDGNRLEVVGTTSLTRLRVYGATAYRGPELGVAIEEMEDAWVDAGYSEAQRIALRRFHAPAVAPALVLDPAALDHWLAGWDSPDLPTRGFRLADREPDEARARLGEALARVEEGGRSRREAYLTGLLAQRLGDHESAVRAFTALDGSMAPLDRLDEDWGLSTLSHLRRAESYEVLADTASALEHYRRFADIWTGADPEVTYLLDEARSAIARLRRP